MSHVLFEDGQFYRDDKPIVGANNRGLRYGDGAFETMKVINGRLQLADWHMERLFAALSLLQFDCPGYFTPDYLIDKILKLVHRNGHSHLSRVRLMVYRGNGSLYDATSHFPHHVIQSSSMPPAQQEWNEDGWIIGFHRVAHKAMDILANAKTNNYLPYLMGALEAKKEKWNDAVLFNAAGRVCDCTIANIFIVKQGILYTPPASEGPVLGVMRRLILEYCEKNKWPVVESPLTEKDVLEAEEVFLTNSGYGIRWVSRLGGDSFSQKLSKQLYLAAIQPLFHF